MQDYIKNVQDVQLYILGELIKLFQAEGLSYIAVGGTALGAIRHQGFIPWDDDIDIAMPRADYDKFLAMQSSLPDDLFIQHFTTDKEYLLYFAKVRKNGTLFLEGRDKNQNMHRGISLDVFPLDTVKLDEDRAAIYKVMQRRFARANKNYSGISGKFKSFVYRAFYPKAEQSFSALDAYVKKNNQNVLAFPLGPPHSNWYLEEDELFPIKELPFETMQIAVPNKVEAYLEKKYGDYMRIPDKEDQIAHSPLKVEFDE